jgi:hypothetical protein
MPTITRRALFRAALAAAAALFAGAAQAQAVPVRLYPVDGGKLSAERTADAQALVEAALKRAAARFDALAPADPLVTRPVCGRRNPGPACVAKLAENGVVVFVGARDRGTEIVFTLSAVDASGRVYGPIRAQTDAFVQNAVPIGDAIAELDRRVSGRGTTPTELRAANTAALLNDLPPPRRVTISYKDSAKPPWQRGTGKALTAGGLLLLGAGTLVGVLDQRLSDDLDRKFREGRLTGADAGSYRTVDRYNLAANALFVVGGVTAATGITLWSIAPAVAPTRGGATIRLSGSF